MTVWLCGVSVAFGVVMVEEGVMEGGALSQMQSPSESQ